MTHGNRKHPVDAGLRRRLLGEWSFGLLDGLNGAVALVLGLLAAHAPDKLIAVGLLSRAGSSAISMGGSEYETDEDSPTRFERTARVAAMMGGYLTSALVPGAGFMVARGFGKVWMIPTTAVCLAVAAWVRSRKHGWLNACALTALIFAAAVGAGLLAAAIAPGS